MQVISNSLNTATLDFFFIFYFEFDSYIGLCGSECVPNKLTIQHKEFQSAQTFQALTYKRVFHCCSLAIFFYLIWD